MESGREKSILDKFLQDNSNRDSLERYIFTLSERIVGPERLADRLYSKSVLHDVAEYTLLVHRTQAALIRQIFLEVFRRNAFDELFAALGETGNNHILLEISKWFQIHQEGEANSSRILETSSSAQNQEPEANSSRILETSSSAQNQEPEADSSRILAIFSSATKGKKILIVISLSVLLAGLCFSSIQTSPDPMVAVLYTTDDSTVLQSVSVQFNLMCSHGLVMNVTNDNKSQRIYYTTVNQSITKLYRVDQKTPRCPYKPLREFGSESHPVDVAYDWIADRIYLAHYSANTIEVCRRGATQGTCFIIVQNGPKSELEGPYHLVVHSPEGLLFWVNAGAEGVSIGRSKMDGTDVRNLYKPLVLGHKIKHVTGLTADMSHQPKLYFSMVDIEGTGVIVSTNLNAESSTMILSRAKWISSVNFLDGRIYWLEEDEIRMTCGEETCVRIEGDGINSFVIYDSRQQPQSRTNHCHGDECSDLCVLSGKTSFTCLCPANQSLGADNKTCDFVKPKRLSTLTS